MIAWLLVAYTAIGTVAVPGIESQAECHRLFVQMAKARKPGFVRYVGHDCVEYFMVKP